MSATMAGAILIVLAAGAGLVGAFEVGLFLALGAIACLVWAPDDERADARRRNQAHPVRRR